MNKRAVAIKITAYTILLISTVLVAAAIRPHVLYHQARFSDTPSVSVLESLDLSGPEGVAQIKELWHSNHLQQRLFVIEAIRKKAHDSKSRYHDSMRSLTLLALADIDYNVKRHAINIVEYQYPEKFQYLLPLLSDSDSMLRFYAARALCRIGNKDCTEFMAPLLNDPVGRNRIMAATALRRWFKTDFGVRFNSKQEKATNALAQWSSWLSLNKDKYRTQACQPKSCATPTIKPPPFSLKDLGGTTRQSTGHDKQVTILYFWGKDDHENVASMREMKRLHEAFTEQVEIIPIAVEAVPKIHLGHEQTDHHDHSHDSPQHSCHHEELSPAESVEWIKAHWTNHGFREYCLIDDGTASAAYNTNVVPVTVFIKNQEIKRRFEEERPYSDLKSMVMELLDTDSN